MSLVDWLITFYLLFLFLSWIVGPKMIAILQGANPNASVTHQDTFIAVVLSVIPIINLAVVFYSLVLILLLKLCDSDKERILFLNELLDESLFKDKKKIVKKEENSGTSSGEDS